MMKVICQMARTCRNAGTCVHAIEHDHVKYCDVWCHLADGTPIGTCVECEVYDIFGDEVEL